MPDHKPGLVLRNALPSEFPINPVLFNLVLRLVHPFGNRPVIATAVVGEGTHNHADGGGAFRPGLTGDVERAQRGDKIFQRGAGRLDRKVTGIGQAGVFEVIASGRFFRLFWEIKKSI